MTPAQFKAFIVHTLRRASMRWPAKNAVKKAARISRGLYHCRGYGRLGHETRTPVVDHIHPVVDPETGFTTWDVYIRRMFPEEEGFQVLCTECHKEKTRHEKSKLNRHRTSNHPGDSQ